MRPPPPFRMVLLVVAAIMLVRVTLGQADAVPPDVDPARRGEQYAIAPGAEQLLSDMLGAGQNLPGGCTFTNGRIEQTRVLATYTCGTHESVLQFLHPEAAPAGGIRTRAFVIEVRDGTPPDELVQAIADRVRAREAAFEWTYTGGHEEQKSRGTLVSVALASLFLLSVLALLAVRKRRSG